MKIQSVKKAINVLSTPQLGVANFARKPEVISIFDTGKLRYINNVIEYPTRKLISSDEVKELFVNGRIDGGELRNQMYRIKFRLFLHSFKSIKDLKLWLHSVDVSSKITKNDCSEVADFMNMHGGKFANLWRGYSQVDMIPNIEKLALFTRSLKRIDNLELYKNLDEKAWMNCIDGIINKPTEIIRPLLEYKYDSREINSAISFGTTSQRVKNMINTITRFLDKQTIKHDMTVYRGEGRFDVFNSVMLDESKKYTLKDALEKITSKIESGKTNVDIKKFIEENMIEKYVTQERFMSTAIDTEAIEDYAKKVYWKIKVPQGSKASLIESYNVERKSEAEMLIQRLSQLLIKDAKYDHKNKRWYIEADLVQNNIEKKAF